MDYVNKKIQYWLVKVSLFQRDTARTISNALFTSPYNMFVRGSGAGRTLYVVNKDEGTVVVCVPSWTCKLAGSGFKAPTAIFVNSAAAYLLNSGDGSISRCPHKEDNTFGACTTSVGFVNPTSFVVVKNDGLAFITVNGGSAIVSCVVKASGTITARDCAPAGSGFSGAFLRLATSTAS